MGTTTHVYLHRSAPANTHAVTPLRPFVWLWRGWRDLRACWPASLAQGLLMAVFGWVLLLMLGNHPYFVSAAVSGFLLLAPILTTGLCELSRLRETGAKPTLDDALNVLNRAGRELFRFGAVLGVIALLWFALSEILLAPVFNVPMPSVADTYYLGFVSEVSRQQVLWFVGTGAVLAFVVYLLSVVTVPLIIDRREKAGAAMAGSLRVALHHPLSLMVWSGLLAAVTIAGFATLLVGMIVLIPLLGHATWHAYRDLAR